MSMQTRPVASRSSRSRGLNWLREGWTAPAGYVSRTPEDRFALTQAATLRAGQI